MKTGSELYEQLQIQKYDYPIGSVEWTYAQTVATAFMLFGSERVFPLLEEAERTGRRLILVEDPCCVGTPSAVTLESHL
ncbi:hypothetical protein GCM10027578_21910 [Spirosoma luteolum]